MSNRDEIPPADIADDLAVAREIARQIGGQAFMLMGTRNRSGTAKSLTFDVKGSDKVGRVRVTLDGWDLYHVEFFRRVPRRSENPVVSEARSVYNDQLKDVIEEHTGLFLSLFPRG